MENARVSTCLRLPSLACASHVLACGHFCRLESTYLSDIPSSLVRPWEGKQQQQHQSPILIATPSSEQARHHARDKQAHPKCLLYEGSDYESWSEKVKILLEHKLQFDDLPLDEIDEFDLSSNDPQGIVDLLRAYASNYVLQRVPDHAKKDPRRLLQSLAGLAKPFRFMELPDHIKIAAGRILLPSQIMFYSDPPRVSSELPPLLRTSQELRKAFLPVFYKETTFCMPSYSYRSKSDQEKRRDVANSAQTFRTWAYQTVPQPDLRWLRKVELSARFSVTFELTGKDEGSRAPREYEITYTTRGWYNAESEKLLKEHVLATNRYRQECGLQGEGLVLLLTSNPELWLKMK